jgi:YfiH family protein
MFVKNREETRWLEFELLSEEKLMHAVILKPITDLRGQAKVIFGSKDFCFVNQVHGNKVIHVDYDFVHSEADSMITNKKNVILGIKHADCQAAIFYDSAQEVIANVHAGWRGLTLKIYQKTINEMKLKYGSKRENILVCIGPSLEPNFSEFIHYEKEFPKSFHKYQTSANYFDLWKIAEEELLEAGIKKDHIEIARMGTFLDCENFFSYRRAKDFLRNYTLVSLI